MGIKRPGHQQGGDCDERSNQGLKNAFCRDKEADPGRVGKSSTSPSDAITLRNPLKIAARRSLSAISTLPEPEPMRLGATAKFDQVGWAR